MNRFFIRRSFAALFWRMTRFSSADRRQLKGKPFLCFFFFFLAPSFGWNTDSLLRSHIELRFGMFMHFNMNTYYPSEWANDRHNPLVFNPSNLDCNQWATAAKNAKMTYGVLTAKHHDGFVIWQSDVTPLVTPAYTIKESSVPTMDVVKSYCEAFRAQGLLPGLYYSMLDVAQSIGSAGGSCPKTPWTPAQKKFVCGQITELLSNYGEIPIFMIDGWDWCMGHKNFPYQDIRDTIKKLQPNCLITDMNGLMSPWEVDIIFVEEPKGLFCPPGNTYAACQAPTITGNWFCTSSYTLMTLQNILSHLTTLESRYCNLLLNCPPNREGTMNTDIVNRLSEVGASWSPNASRAPLPAQPANIDYPITPSTATASSGTAANAIDGFADCYSSDQQTYCTRPGETLWSSSGSLPQYVTMDLGTVVQNIGIVGYLPQAAATEGQITGYTVSLSTDGTTFSTVSNGTWPANRNYKTVTFTPTAARYVRLTATAVSSGSAAIASEVDCGVVPSTTVSGMGGVRRRPTAFSVQATCRMANGRFVFPGDFSGRAVSVGVYNLSGKLLRRAAIEEGIFDMEKNGRLPEGVYIVTINRLP
ncbi:MAG: alpha-L-fucosidase [Chitinispirillaceae bacterium]|nr:alpha-L-fucosidase [Chitinispirillaceae bacterium]